MVAALTHPEVAFNVLQTCWMRHPACLPGLLSADMLAPGLRVLQHAGYSQQQCCYLCRVVLPWECERTSSRGKGRTREVSCLRISLGAAGRLSQLAMAALKSPNSQRPWSGQKGVKREHQRAINRMGRPSALPVDPVGHRGRRERPNTGCSAAEPP